MRGFWRLVIFSAGIGNNSPRNTRNTRKKKNRFVFEPFVYFVCFVGKKKKFNDHPFAYRQEIELEIVTLTNLGLGLGRVAAEQQGQRQAGYGLRSPRQVGKQERAEHEKCRNIEPMQHAVHGKHCSARGLKTTGAIGDVVYRPIRSRCGANRDTCP